jgi:hypothetical protein
MKLKVFGYHKWHSTAPPANNGDRTVRVIVATTSQKKAAELFGATVHDLRNYGAVTGNEREVRLGLKFPGVVMWVLDDYRKGPFRFWNTDEEVEPNGL